MGSDFHLHWMRLSTQVFCAEGQGNVGGWENEDELDAAWTCNSVSPVVKGRL